MQIMQQIQSYPLVIKTDQISLSLVEAEQKAKSYYLKWPLQTELWPSHLIVLQPTPSLEMGQRAKTESRFSSQPLLTDTPKKTKKAWFEQAFYQFRTNLSLVKARVSVWDRKVRLEKYRLSQQAAERAGPAGSELLEAFVFGSVKSLEKSTKNNLKILGLLHVASASGANVAIVTTLVRRGTNWIKFPKLRFCLLVAAIFCYADLAEFSASIVRASLAAGYRFFGEFWLRRPTHPLIALGFSAVTMAVSNPGYLTNLSFQLSCLAGLGITCFAQVNAAVEAAALPLRTDGLQPHVATQSLWRGRIAAVWQTSYRRITQTLSDSFWTSVAAQLFITPLLWWQFGDWSPLSLVANPLLLWLTPFITQLSLALVVVTAWADKWPSELCWSIQNLLGQSLNFTAQLFQWGVTGLSRAGPWLASHYWFRYSMLGWWLLSGFVVVKVLSQHIQKSRRSFDVF